MNADERDRFINYLNTLVVENESVMKTQAKHTDIVATKKRENKAAQLIIAKLNSLEVNVH